MLPWRHFITSRDSTWTKYMTSFLPCSDLVWDFPCSGIRKLCVTDLTQRSNSFSIDWWISLWSNNTLASVVQIAGISCMCTVTFPILAAVGVNFVFGLRLFNQFNTGRIQIKVLTTLPFFFLRFLVSKDNIYKSKMCNQWRITISFQLKI